MCQRGSGRRRNLPPHPVLLTKGGTLCGHFSTSLHNRCTNICRLHRGADNMVRTKADSVPAAYRKAVAASAPRKSLGSGSSNSSCSSQTATPAKNKYAGGNPVCPRPTPTWQKGIGDFFGGPPRKPEKENQRPGEAEDDEEAGGSGMSKANRKSRPLPAEEDD